VTTHPAPEPTGPRHHRVAVRGWVRWAIGIAVLVAIVWAIIAMAPRQPRPRLVSDPEAAPAESCGAFGGEPSDPADGSVGFVPCTLPTGFVLIEPPVDVGSSANTDGTAQPYVVYYSRMIGDDAPDSIAVITVASDVPEPGGDTVVRGHPARLVEPSADGLPLQLRWTERPGLNVQISAWGSVSVAEVLEVAEGLTPRAPFDPTSTTAPAPTAPTTSTTPGDGTSPSTGGTGSSTTSTPSTGGPGSTTTTTTTTTTAPTGTGPSSTTSTTGPTTTTSSDTSTTTTTTSVITVPPVIDSIVPTLPSVTTTRPDLLDPLGDVPVIGDLPIVGPIVDPPDDDAGDEGGISDLPVIGGLPILGSASTTTTTADADAAATPAATPTD
jgi:hypothetical protein